MCMYTYSSSGPLTEKRGSVSASCDFLGRSVLPVPGVSGPYNRVSVDQRRDVSSVNARRPAYRGTS